MASKNMIVNQVIAAMTDAEAGTESEYAESDGEGGADS